MDHPPHVGRQRGERDVLGAMDVHRLVVREGVPEAHHSREVEHRVDATHRHDQGPRLANVSDIGLDVPLLKPGRVFAGQGEHSDLSAPSLKLRYEMSTEKAHCRQ